MIWEGRGDALEEAIMMNRMILAGWILSLLFVHTPAIGKPPKMSLPDLVPMYPSISVENSSDCPPAGGESLGLNITISNIGDGYAGSFSIQINQLTTYRFEGIPAHSSTHRWLRGEGQMGDNVIVADILNEVSESNEINNTLFTTLPIPTQRPTCTLTFTPTDTGQIPTATFIETETPTPTETLTSCREPRLFNVYVSPEVALPGEQIELMADGFGGPYPYTNWEQVSGTPHVELSCVEWSVGSMRCSFTAPSVTSEVNLTFEYTLCSSGLCPSCISARVTVRILPEKTPTPTITETPHPTITETFTEIPTVSSTPTLTGTSTATYTHTASISPTETNIPTITFTPRPTATPGCDSGLYLLLTTGQIQRAGNPPLINGGFMFGGDLARDMERAVSNNGTEEKPDLVVLDGSGVTHFVENAADDIPQDFLFPPTPEFPIGRAVDLVVSRSSEGLWVLTDYGGIYRAGDTKDSAEGALVPGTAQLGALGYDVPIGFMRDPRMANPGGASIRAVALIVIDVKAPFNRADGYIVIDSLGAHYSFNPDGTRVMAGIAENAPMNDPVKLLDPDPERGGYVWPYFAGLDIARDAELYPETQEGLVVFDGWGGIHPVPVDVRSNAVFFTRNEDPNAPPGTLITTVGMPYLVIGFDDPETQQDEGDANTYGADAYSIFNDFEFSAGCPDGGFYTLDKFGAVYVFGSARTMPDWLFPAWRIPYVTSQNAQDIELFAGNETGPIPTPSITPSARPTSTPSMTSTPTPTYTATPTEIIPTWTRTPSSTPTGTETPTPSVSVTSTLTLTVTSTETPTRSFTDTTTLTFTPSETGTDTTTETATLTPTETFTSTSTYTETFTQSPTMTDTDTATSTATQILTDTLTETPAVTETVTSTVTYTETNTTTATETVSVTMTPSETPFEPTYTFTPSNTTTMTQTGTPFEYPSVTFTFTPTLTESAIPTPTETFTMTMTETFFMTPTATTTITETPTSAQTPTCTVTFTETSTPTPTVCVQAARINLYCAGETSPNAGPFVIKVVPKIQPDTCDPVIYSGPTLAVVEVEPASVADDDPFDDIPFSCEEALSILTEEIIEQLNSQEFPTDTLQPGTIYVETFTPVSFLLCTDEAGLPCDGPLAWPLDVCGLGNLGDGINGNETSFTETNTSVLTSGLGILCGQDICRTPTPTLTPTITNTRTITNTPTISQTPTISYTRTNTRTRTATHSWTSTRTPTGTRTPSRIPFTRTPTPTTSPTLVCIHAANIQLVCAGEPSPEALPFRIKIMPGSSLSTCGPVSCPGSPLAVVDINPSTLVDESPFDETPFSCEVALGILASHIAEQLNQSGFPVTTDGLPVGNVYVHYDIPFYFCLCTDEADLPCNGQNAWPLNVCGLGNLGDGINGNETSFVDLNDSGMTSGLGVICLPVECRILPTATPTTTSKNITIPLPNLPENAHPLCMIRIPAGKFWMGSPGNERGRTSNEEPVHEVKINYDFYLSETEVTQAQWQAVMGSNPSYFKDSPDHPVD